jgi:DNA-binding GntR family transcriptional regulator
VGVNAETAGERAYRHIRRDILFGRLAPAQKLKLDGLKESYGVSISTLRELLSRLTSEGLIVAEGARGFEVAPISPENLKEVANLRQLLECHAMALSFATGDMEWEGELSRRITSWRWLKAECLQAIEAHQTFGSGTIGNSTMR